VRLDTSPSSADFAFNPAWWLPGRHLQTIIPTRWPAPALPGPTETLDVPVADRSAVRLRIDRPDAAAKGTLLLIHGMGGSADSKYMRHSATQALARDWTVARMNLRNCGATEALSQTLYNAGQSDDVGYVLDALTEARCPHPLAAMGFSLGGNILLRYAARAEHDCRADAVAAINPPIDLERCASELERPVNRLYQLYYVKQLRAQLDAVLRVRELTWAPPRPNRIRSVREFDDLYTAPDAGYPTAEAYYAASSAGPCLGQMRRPALILSAANDPFVPAEIFSAHHGLATIRFIHPERGGHCGYWQSRAPHYWAAQLALDFFDEL
jgi:predicted alpha/beta-fold hydrolase